MSDYLSLEEAAAKLGIPTDRLVDLRSQGQVRGFRDGASWKFPDSEIDRLADELAATGSGSGLVLDESGLGLSIDEGDGSDIISGDTPSPGSDGSDINLGDEILKLGSSGSGSGSDVNLVATGGEGSDVTLVPASGDNTDPDASDLPSGLDVGDLLEIDSAELQLDDPAITHDSAMIDIAIDPKEGSTGPVAKKPSGKQSTAPSLSSDSSISDSGLGLDNDNLGDSDLGFSESNLEEDSDDVIIGDDDSSAMDMLGSDLDLSSGSDAIAGKASSLELLDELNDVPRGSGSLMSSGADVLSELDLLGAEQEDSGLISGDSSGLLASSGISDDIIDSKDDALNDDDLVISDDDDDLVIDSHGSDISIAGDSGINLMSPSDSGLSLESEPLDLAGSSISALDLGAELAEDGSDIGSDGGSGGAVDFQSDEEFQLSPSGIALEADIESGSQVIEVEDSEAIGEAVEFDDAGFGADADFATEADAAPLDEAVAFDDTEAGPQTVAVTGATAGGFEIPFSLMQCLSLAGIVIVMSLCGMLMTDLVRNMWTYTEPAAPVSSLTGYLIELMGW